MSRNDQSCPTQQFWLLLFISAFFLSGCSYKLGFHDRTLPGGYENVAVPVFKNSTAEASVEVDFTNALLREFARSNLVHIVSRDMAQVTIEGAIDSVQYIPFAPIAGSNSRTKPDATSILPVGVVLNSQYQILVSASIRLRRNSDRKILWEGKFRGERNYMAAILATVSINTANATYDQSARHQNLTLLAGDMMAEAHDRLTESF